MAAQHIQQRVALLVVAAVLLLLCLLPQSEAKPVARCRHDHPSTATMRSINKQMATARTMARLDATMRGASGPPRIPVHFHILTAEDGTMNADGTINPDGTGSVSRNQLTAQIQVLNAAKGYQGNFIFELANMTSVANNNWFNNVATDTTTELQMKMALRVPGNNVLNVYTLNGGEYLGFSYFPNILSNAAPEPYLDGVVVDFRTLPGGAYAPWNLGGTMVHEIGHWLLLSHTFQGGCSAQNDYVADTPAEATASSSCQAGRDTCKGSTPWDKGPDPIHNFMDYSPDTCYQAFTPGQVARMQNAFLTYRSSFGVWPPSASGTMGTAAGVAHSNSG